MKTYAVGYADGFLKFGSYNEASIVYELAKASCYSSEKLIRKVLKSKFNHEYIYIGRDIRVPKTLISILEMEYEITGEKKLEPLS